MTKFRELQVGDTFDFVNDEPGQQMYNTFYERCTKVSPRGYTWFSSLTATTLRSNVGSLNVEVHHVENKEQAS